MTKTVLIPKVGMGTTEGTIAKWHKNEGDAVNEGEVIVDIEMAKGLEEIPSPATGTLTKILLAEGATADVHTAIALIEETA